MSIIDSRTIAEGTQLDADICIVGGGAAGITLARELIGTPYRVCLLESGGLEPDPQTQSLDAGENVGYPYYPLDTARSRSLGGSSTMWHVPIDGTRVGARMRPLDPIDFEQRDWVPYSGWPFGVDHLQPYYERAQALCRIEPASFDAADWHDPERRPAIRFADDSVQTIVYKIAWRDLFATVYPQEVMRAEQVTTCLHASVQRIETTGMADHVDRLRVATLAGNHFFVRARRFVLAAGGLETPRLLLMSNDVVREGLGNQHDLVGRFFMEHLHFWSGMLVPDDPGVFERTGFYNDIHCVRNVAVVGKLALQEHVLRRERLLNQNVQLFPRRRPDPFTHRKPSPEPIRSLKAMVGHGQLTAENVRTVVQGWDDISAVVGRKLRQRVLGRKDPLVFIFANMAEQVPNPASRVTLGTERDRFGCPRLRLDWRITPQDVRSAVRTQEILACAFERIGWGRTYRDLLGDAPPPNTHGGYHHMGTTRMHVDPRQGVVDANARVHGIDNLYIAGPSVFPTGGYANPTLTTLALTLRLADHLKTNGEGPHA